MNSPDLAQWIATDKSDAAERVRASLRATWADLVDLVDQAREFETWSARFDHRHMMRRKLRRMVRGC